MSAVESQFILYIYVGVLKMGTFKFVYYAYNFIYYLHANRRVEFRRLLKFMLCWRRYVCMGPVPAVSWWLSAAVIHGRLWRMFTRRQWRPSNARVSQNNVMSCSRVIYCCVVRSKVNRLRHSERVAHIKRRRPDSSRLSERFFQTTKCHCRFRTSQKEMKTHWPRKHSAISTILLIVDAIKQSDVAKKFIHY